MSVVSSLFPCQFLDGVGPRGSVTTVGGTFFDNDEPEETGAFISGGGFSTFFGHPRYQDAAVSAYLQATNNAQATAFNVSGRAGGFITHSSSFSSVVPIKPQVPDVSAIAQISYISDGAIIDGASATEFSADIFASIIALLTNERIAAGKPGLGFLNPLIYANPGAFNDITTGARFRPECPKCSILKWCTINQEATRAVTPLGSTRRKVGTRYVLFFCIMFQLSWILPYR
jgi:hypothetical protein